VKFSIPCSVLKWYLTQKRSPPEGRLGEPGDVGGHLEVPMCAAALRVHDALGDSLTVELGHLLDHVVILKQDRTVRADRQRVVIAG
jgi:hypothetical protein